MSKVTGQYKVYEPEIGKNLYSRFKLAMRYMVAASQTNSDGGSYYTFVRVFVWELNIIFVTRNSLGHFSYIECAFDIIKLTVVIFINMEFSSKYRKTECRKKCSVKGCCSTMNKNTNLSFHTVPKTGVTIQRTNLFNKIETVDKRAEWLRKLNIKDSNQEVIVCSKHFTPIDYCLPGTLFSAITKGFINIFYRSELRSI